MVICLLVWAFCQRIVRSSCGVRSALRKLVEELTLVIYLFALSRTVRVSSKQKINIKQTSADSNSGYSYLLRGQPHLVCM